MKKNFLVRCLFLFSVIPATVPATFINAQTTVRLQDYLLLENLAFPNPCFSRDPDINGAAFSTEKLMKYPFFTNELRRDARPEEGEEFSWRGRNEKWKRVDAGYPVSINLPDSTWNSWCLSVFYTQTEQFSKPTVHISYAPVFELYLDGTKVTGQSKAADTLQPKALKKEVDLEPGYHIWVVKALYQQGTETGGRLDFSLGFDSLSAVQAADVEAGSSVKENYNLYHYLNAPSVYAPQISYSGDYVSLKISTPDADLAKTKTEYRIYPLAGKDYVTVPAAPAFASRAGKYAYIRKEGSYKHIYAAPLGRPAQSVYKTEKDLSAFHWDPLGRFVILEFAEKAEKGKTGLKYIYNPMDQWPWYRNRISLAKLDLQSGSVVPLTYGYKEIRFLDLSSDGEKMLFCTGQNADTVRAYTRQTVWCMNLSDGSVREIFSTFFAGSAQFSPQADKLLVIGSEAMFAQPEDLIPNDYDNEAFIYDLAEGTCRNITQGFGPNIQSAVWENSGAYIYFKVEEGSCNRLYAYNTASDKFSLIPLETEVLSGFDVCAGGLVYTGSDINKPSRGYYVKGTAAKASFAKQHTCLANPQEKEFENLVLGGHREWSYTNREGGEIEAVYYLPPGFDSAKKYPCIVYYYGGTSPTPRALNMRYPKTVWAGNGYIVLVLQPSGATGYSREFSAAHVNNWGKTVAGEIIDGVTQFYRRHPFVDSTRLGCIGASYGGFMTQLLITQTDIFRAAVSHAGISSIASYWGEGYWGYQYCSAANANSFPWNRRDIFVDQSPLFNADKIHTPLLLLHGTSDTNVPPGESWQMYKALRILGREVAMVTVDGENHGITDYAKRLQWEKTIMAWFEKHLKGNALWWNTIYPDKKL